jgi:hypothetical protein
MQGLLWAGRRRCEGFEREFSCEIDHLPSCLSKSSTAQTPTCSNQRTVNSDIRIHRVSTLHLLISSLGGKKSRQCVVTNVIGVVGKRSNRSHHPIHNRDRDSSSMFASFMSYVQVAQVLPRELEMGEMDWW